MLFDVANTVCIHSFTNSSDIQCEYMTTKNTFESIQCTFTTGNAKHCEQASQT